MDKIKLLLQTNQQLFHSGDLRRLWQIENTQTLHTSIHRLTKREILFPLQKGLYSTVPIQKINPLQLGAAFIHDYCYLGGEYVLAQAGYIQQSLSGYTFFAEQSRRIRYYNYYFMVRQLKPLYLYHPEGIEKTEQGILTSSIERAVADLHYIHPAYFFDSNDRIDWDRVKDIQRKVGYR